MSRILKQAEAIILAGGLGTRLRSILPDTPKVMAPVAGRPFLEYLLAWLSAQGIGRVIMALGYKCRMIQNYFGTAFQNLIIDYSIETEPAGTGGALARAFSLVKRDEVFLLNGDTFFAVPLAAMMDFQQENQADLTMALKPVKDVSRYGAVELQGPMIDAFREKGGSGPGFINGGLVLLKKTLSESMPAFLPLSLEKEVFPDWLEKKRFCGYTCDGFFIDIGVPDDYSRACKELSLVITPS